MEVSIEGNKIYWRTNLIHLTLRLFKEYQKQIEAAISWDEFFWKWINLINFSVLSWCNFLGPSVTITSIKITSNGILCQNKNIGTFDTGFNT